MNSVVLHFVPLLSSLVSHVANKHIGIFLIWGVGGGPAHVAAALRYEFSGPLETETWHLIGFGSQSPPNNTW
jgi:hypothetical protein